MTKKKLKLFVWEDVLTNWTSGMMVAIAPSVEEARVALRKKSPYLPSEDVDSQPKEYDLTEPAVFIVWGGD